MVSKINFATTPRNMLGSRSAHRAVQRNMERYLEVEGIVCPLRSFRGARAAGGEARALPQALSPIARLLGHQVPGRGDLHELIDAEQAQQLWARVVASAERLSRDPSRSHLADPEKLDSWGTAMMIAAVIADGTMYPYLPLKEASKGQPWSPDGQLDEALWRRRTQRVLGRERGRRWADRLEGLELWAVSAAHWMKTDVRSLFWLARQPMRRGFRGLCRHYGVLFQILFDAAKRATGRHRHAHVLTIYGDHSFLAPFAHAWSWFVDEERGTVIALDLTGADWLMDRRGAESIFNEGFDATRWNNVSAFLRTLVDLYGETRLRSERDLIAGVLMSIVDPESLRGQILLHRLARQSLLAPKVRQRIVRHLEGSDFARDFAAWRLQVRFAEGSWRSRAIDAAVDARPALELMERIGLSG